MLSSTCPYHLAQASREGSKHICWTWPVCWPDSRTASHPGHLLHPFPNQALFNLRPKREVISVTILIVQYVASLYLPQYKPPVPLALLCYHSICCKLRTVPLPCDTGNGQTICLINASLLSSSSFLSTWFSFWEFIGP